MNSHKLQFPNVLRRLVDAVERLSEDDLSKLGDESYSIEIRLTRKRNKDDAITPIQEVDLANVIEKLTNFPSREDAQQFLDANFSTRKSVELIARKLDIPISRQDKVEILRDKVIEATVGARVRSQAIQGGKV
ncbi:hypothetical protein HER14_07585 [Acidithiobacillus thiooxidans]|uniref:hypothetical protein n=1 Tax=Acidithiobacillus TaxID=119977 RepID=UPI00187A933E|nr:MULTISPECIES: hypothetical protein [Acidithiobacillus]MBE7567998.1 hypothetical protein [Acidithiobacillus sp. HP-11]MBU2750806.1 hypothetical protein [Acidithiobacillus thiooxidans]MBU2792861.1 hypothetical protein [Acidithiobacillus thiooxidans]